MPTTATPTPPLDRAANARAEHMRRAADRAVDDPVKLDRAARIVRAALARQRLTVAELLPEDLGAGGGSDAA